MPVGVDRRAGYRRALAAAGIVQDDGLEANGHFTQEGGATAMRAILARHPDVDAVFAASDLMAIGASCGGQGAAFPMTWPSWGSTIRPWPTLRSLR